MSRRDAEADPVHRIARLVLAYLERHPQAEDTVDGISAWWLRGQRLSSRDDLLRALDKLVEEGHLVKHVRLDGSCVFRSHVA
jgi:hypothetical protein